MARQPRLDLNNKPLWIDCDVDIIAIAKGDKYEGSCPCGWRMKGTKAECTAGANGHKMPKP